MTQSVIVGNHYEIVGYNGEEHVIRTNDQRTVCVCFDRFVLFIK